MVTSISKEGDKMNTKKLLLTTLAGLSIFSLTSCKGDENYPRSFTVNFVTGEGGQEISSQTVKEGYLLKGVSSPLEFIYVL